MTTGALLSTIICFLRPASEKPPASPRSVMTSSRVCSSSSDQAGRSVFAWTKKLSNLNCIASSPPPPSWPWPPWAPGYPPWSAWSRCVWCVSLDDLGLTDPLLSSLQLRKHGCHHYLQMGQQRRSRVRVIHDLKMLFWSGQDRWRKADTILEYFLWKKNKKHPLRWYLIIFVMMSCVMFMSWMKGRSIVSDVFSFPKTAARGFLFLMSRDIFADRNYPRQQQQTEPSKHYC